MSDKNYPREVEIIKNIIGYKEVKETHISYAIIGDEFVYKIKKSVDFGFLNYKLPRDRRGFCILEKELNERFSKGIYLEVLKLVRKTATEFALVPIENSLTAVEYVLKMKRIKDGDFLQNRVDKGEIGIDKMVEIGKDVALLFKKLDAAPKDENFSCFFDAVKFNAVENFNQTEKYIGSLIDKDSFNFIQKKTFEFFEANKNIFNDRFESGYVKNGHGDLRLEHIYFNDDGSVGLIDCIEFNKRFRFIDSVAEAAFLSMELDCVHRSDYADKFLEGFFQVFDDANSIKLLNYYRSYFAYVRAKVTCFLVEGKDPSWEFFSDKVAEIRRLIDMSAFYCSNLEQPSNMVFYGLMGTGKSKNAKGFAERFPIFRINSDEERKKAAGITPEEKRYLQWDEGIYSFENSLKTYACLGAEVAKRNAVGRPCLVDASFTKNEFSNEFLKQLRGNFPSFIRFTASDNIIKMRLDARLTKAQVTDGRFEIFINQRETAIMPQENILIDTSGEMAANVEIIFKNILLKS